MAPNSQHETDFEHSEVPIPPKSIRVEDKIYSAEALAKLHPGGPLFIKSFAGRDASQAFLSYHRRKFPHSKVEGALECVDPSVQVDTSGVNEDFLELCARVDKVIPRSKSFAPWHYYLKAIFILGMAVGLEGYMHWTKSYRWYLTAITGFFFAIIGMAIQHDANHGALSKNPWVNRLWGLTMNWMGGSSISWIHQHVVQHHVHTNDVHLDPDIQSRLLVRLNPKQRILKIHLVQHIYYFLIILAYGFMLAYGTLSAMIEGINFTPVSPLLNKHRIFEVATWFVFFFRWIVFPLYQVPSIYTALNIVPLFMVTGWYLAFFFTISHNFQGVHMVDDTSTKKSWLWNQVVTSSNVAGAKLCFLNGGLNYQIEHHLFPRIHHGHYPTIAPVVKQFCQEKGIPYNHFDTIYENVVACIQHLFVMGNQEVPEAAKGLKYEKEF